MTGIPVGSPPWFVGVLEGGWSKDRGHLRHVGGPRGALRNTREYWGVLS